MYLGQNSNQRDDTNTKASKSSLVHPFTLCRRANRWCVRRLQTSYWLHTTSVTPVPHLRTFLALPIRRFFLLKMTETEAPFYWDCGLRVSAANTVSSEPICQDPCCVLHVISWNLYVGPALGAGNHSEPLHDVSKHKWIQAGRLSLLYGKIT